MSEWKVSSNYIGGLVYQVYRILDETGIDHAGNRKYYPKIFETKEEAQAIADKLNKEDTK